MAHPVQVIPLYTEGPHPGPLLQGRSWWPLHRRVVNTREGLPPRAVGSKGRSARCSRVSLAGNQSPLLQAGALEGRGWKPAPGAERPGSGDAGKAAKRPGRAGQWLEEGCTGRAPHLPWWNLSSGCPGVRERN